MKFTTNRLFIVFLIEFVKFCRIRYFYNYKYFKGGEN